MIIEHLGKIEGEIGEEQELALTKELMKELFTSKKDGETVYNFEERVRKEGLRVLGLD